MSMMIAGSPEALALCAEDTLQRCTPRTSACPREYAPGSGGTMDRVNNLGPASTTIASGAEALALGPGGRRWTRNSSTFAWNASVAAWMFGDRMPGADRWRQTGAAPPCPSSPRTSAWRWILGRGLAITAAAGRGPRTRYFLSRWPHGHADEDDNGAVFRVYQALTGVELP